MLMYIVFILLSFAAALLIVFLWEKSWTVLPPAKSRCVVLYPVKGHREDVEYLLRALIKKADYGESRQVRIIVVDCGMDEETKHICSLFLKDRPQIELCEAKELTSLISQNV